MRKQSKTGIYHATCHGVACQDIFYDKEDRLTFLNILAHLKRKHGVELYAYSLMPNHSHLLLHENEEGKLSAFMKSLLSTYAQVINEKYQRTGHLFQSRFWSQPIESESYLLAVFRYIHQNPEKAGMKRFAWTSYDEYERVCSFEDYVPEYDLVDTAFLIPLLPDDQTFYDFMAIEQASLKQIYVEVTCTEIARTNKIINLNDLDEENRNKYLTRLHQSGVSLRQIELATGINRNTIFRAIKKERETKVV